MHVDQARQDGLARGIDWLGIERFRIGKIAVVNLGDLSASHEHRARLDHLAIADKDARILDQPASVRVADRAPGSAP